MDGQHPILSTAFWRRPGAAKEVAGDDIYGLNARAAIAAFPGPAILFAGGGRVLAANAEAARLIRVMAAEEAPDIRVLLAGVATTGRPAVGQIFLPSDPATGETQALFYLTAIALEQANGQAQNERGVMVQARDASAEHAMRNALIESRDLYRDLSRCSSDFSWQTDENGAFTFVSAKGALGYSAQALNGRRSQNLLEQSPQNSQENPFIVRTPVENVEIAMHDVKGDIRHCRVDALPVYDKKNQWRGARGVSTDITEAKRHQQALEFMHQRESQVRAIVDAAHSSLDPAVAFSEAATRLASAIGALQCIIMSLDNKRRLRVLGASSSVNNSENLVMLSRVELEIQDAVSKNGGEPLSFSEAGVLHQVTLTTHAGVPNGAIWLQNPEKEISEKNQPVLPGGYMRSLAQTVMGHIGIAIAHDNQVRRLAELSRTDELTGLMNRRAFMEDLQQRHGHLYRVSRTGALLYIDLDNFKPVNDRFGHAAGDQVLKEFANILAGHSRIGDLCARLGGDEFAIWLEDTGAGGAEVKARHLIEKAKLLCRLAGITAAPDMPELGLSIGIAVADPGLPEQLPQLIRRADEVMYLVKRQGKGTLIVAPPAGVMASKSSAKRSRQC